MWRKAIKMWRKEAFLEVEKSNNLLFLKHIPLNCGDNIDFVDAKGSNVATITF
jgi:hypothetical protein